MKSGKTKYCKKCGSFIPAWSDECLSCGAKREERKRRKNIVDEIEVGPYTIKNAYFAEAPIKIELCDVGRYGRDISGKYSLEKKRLAKFTITLIGEIE